MLEEIKKALSAMVDNNLTKIVISNPLKASEYKKIEILKKSKGYQAAKYTDKQVFHENITVNELLKFLELALNDFVQINAWSSDSIYELKLSKKGKVFFKGKKISQESSEILGVNTNISANKTANASVNTKANLTANNIEHNRKKNYILEEGTIILPLIDMGIFTSDGKVVKSMYDKFKQINRFVEIVDDTIKGKGYDVLNIIDFGCGKSYLTFILYYYLVYIKGIKADIVGLDLKEDVINNCNKAAIRYGYEGLKFELGDINGYKNNKDIDMVITLHACDTATDYALYNAVSWNANIILSVPCCQHELNGQLASENLKILENYGILKERFASIATDAIRGNILTSKGYKTQILEFVDMSHTPKNVLIRAVKQPMLSEKKKRTAIDEVEALMKEFHFEPMLYKLFN